jgi:hypothetical protein
MKKNKYMILKKDDDRKKKFVAADQQVKFNYSIINKYSRFCNLGNG